MNIITGEEEALSRRAIESALNGNTQMLQFCLSRILPPPPKDTIVKLDGMPECDDIESSITLSSFVLPKCENSTIGRPDQKFHKVYAEKICVDDDESNRFIITSFYK